MATAEKDLKMQVDFSLTVNLGNFNSAKLGATLEDKISSIEEFDEHFDILYKKIRQKVSKELHYLNKAFKQTSKD